MSEKIDYGYVICQLVGYPLNSAPGSEIADRVDRRARSAMVEELENINASITQAKKLIPGRLSALRLEQWKIAKSE